jgi:hypothetical protein
MGSGGFNRKKKANKKGLLVMARYVNGRTIPNFKTG